MRGHSEWSWWVWENDGSYLKTVRQLWNKLDAFLCWGKCWQCGRNGRDGRNGRKSRRTIFNTIDGLFGGGYHVIKWSLGGFSSLSSVIMALCWYWRVGGWMVIILVGWVQVMSECYWGKKSETNFATRVITMSKKRNSTLCLKFWYLFFPSIFLSRFFPYDHPQYSNLNPSVFSLRW